MAKRSGLGDNFYIAGFNVSGDVNSLSRINGGPAALDATAINKSAFERLGGKRDGGFTFTSIFNDAAGQQHEALKTLPTTSRIGTYFRGQAVGNPAASCQAKQIMYDGDRGEDGMLIWTADLQSDSYGLEWGIQMTAGAHSAGAGFDGTAVDTLASVSFGGQLYLQVMSFTGTNAFLGMSHSDDDAVGDPYTAIGAGALEQEVTAAPNAYRLESSRTLAVKRWIRFYASGTFSQLTVAAMFVKNETAVTY
jgi:hypothetical protein